MDVLERATGQLRRGSSVRRIALLSAALSALQSPEEGTNEEQASGRGSGFRVVGGLGFEW